MDPSDSHTNLAEVDAMDCSEHDHDNVMDDGHDIDVSQEHEHAVNLGNAAKSDEFPAGTGDSSNLTSDWPAADLNKESLPGQDATNADPASNIPEMDGFSVEHYNRLFDFGSDPGADSQSLFDFHNDLDPDAYQSIADSFGPADDHAAQNSTNFFGDQPEQNSTNFTGDQDGKDNVWVNQVYFPEDNYDIECLVCELYKEENEKLRSSFNDTRAEVARLESQLADDVAASKQEIRDQFESQLKTCKDQLEEQNNTHRLTLHSKEDELKVISARLEGLQNRETTAERVHHELAQAQRERDEIKAQLERRNEEMEAQKAQMDERSKNDTAELNGRLSASEQERDGIRAEKANMHEEVQRYTAEQDSKLVAAEKEREELRAQLDSKQKELESVNAQLNQINDGWKNDIAEWNEKANKIEMEGNVVRAQLREKNEEYDSLKRQLAHGRELQDHKDEQLRDDAMKIAELETKVYKCKEEMHEKERTLRNLERKVTSQEQSLQERIDEADMCREQYERLKVDLGKKLKKAVNERNSRTDELKQEHDQIQADLHAQIKDLEGVNREKVEKLKMQEEDLSFYRDWEARLDETNNIPTSPMAYEELNKNMDEMTNEIAAVEEMHRSKLQDKDRQIEILMAQRDQALEELRTSHHDSIDKDTQTNPASVAEASAQTEVTNPQGPQASTMPTTEAAAQTEGTSALNAQESTMPTTEAAAQTEERATRNAAVQVQRIASTASAAVQTVATVVEAQAPAMPALSAAHALFRTPIAFSRRDSGVNLWWMALVSLLLLVVFVWPFVDMAYAGVLATYTPTVSMYGATRYGFDRHLPCFDIAKLLWNLGGRVWVVGGGMG